jgi:hypothetical protein
MPVQHNLLVGRKLEQHINDFGGFINMQDIVKKMLNAWKDLPMSYAIIETVVGHGVAPEKIRYVLQRLFFIAF